MLDEVRDTLDASDLTDVSAPELSDEGVDEGKAEADDISALSDGTAFSVATLAAEETGTSAAAARLLLLGTAPVEEAEADTTGTNVASTPNFLAQSAALSFSGQQ